MYEKNIYFGQYIVGIENCLPGIEKKYENISNFLENIVNCKNDIY